MAQLFKNNAKTTLNGSLTAGATSIVVTDASPFGAVTSPDFMLLTLFSGSPENKWEIVKVTAISSNTLTVVRAQEGTTGQAWNSGDAIECRWTAGSANITIRETFSDAAYTVSGANGADRMVGQVGTLSASRTVTLPAASGRAGQRLIILDESGSVTWSNNIVITRAGSDAIYGTNGNSATSIRIWVPYGGVELISDGSAKWIIVRRFPSRWYVRWTANTTFNREPDMKLADVGCQGGGGGGGSSSRGSNFYGGGGGGGVGAWVSRRVDVSGSATFSVTVGDGGIAGATAGANGGAGGTSSFGSLVSATGGNGGAGASTTNGGNGGLGPTVYLGFPYVTSPIVDGTEANAYRTKLSVTSGGAGDGTTVASGATTGQSYGGSAFSGGNKGSFSSGNYTGGGGGAGSIWANGGNGATYSASWTDATPGSLGSGGGGGGTHTDLSFGVPAAGGPGFVEATVFF